MYFPIHRVFGIIPLLFPLVPLSALAVCPAGDPNAFSYIRRDNNRCEGLRDRQDASGSLSLVSFVTTNLSAIGESLTIRVAGNPNPNLEIQEFSRNYRLDDVQMQRDNRSASFPLNTRILQKAGITQPIRLRAIAYVLHNSSPVYYPTILGHASDSYTFVLYAPKPTAFKTIQIRQIGNPKPFVKYTLSQPREGQIPFPWKYGNAPAGDYELYLEDHQGQQRRFSFKHNRQWL